MPDQDQDGEREQAADPPTVNGEPEGDAVFAGGEPVTPSRGGRRPRLKLFVPWRLFGPDDCFDLFLSDSVFEDEAVETPPTTDRPAEASEGEEAEGHAGPGEVALLCLLWNLNGCSGHFV